MLEKIVAPLVEWYGINARALPWRMSKAPYGIWVSEIMLQQTRVSAVIEYFKRFMTALPTIEALAEAKEEELLKLWEGLGYYTRVRNLQKAAKVIVQEHQGCFPQTYEAVIALPGIGAYTAGAICSIAFEQKTPAVDGNVLRVMSRLTENYGDIGKASVKKQVEQQLKAIYPEGRCGDFTQSLMELGATICIPKGEPDCGACPVSSFCRGYQNNTYKELPIKAKKIQRRKEKKTVFLLTCGEEYAIEKREKGG
ncbi:MAG: A/G-specific adenine glycosylase, partial [Anaerovoracaceae bacterium]